MRNDFMLGIVGAGRIANSPHSPHSAYEYELGWLLVHKRSDNSTRLWRRGRLHVAHEFRLRRLYAEPNYHKVPRTHAYTPTLCTQTPVESRAKATYIFTNHSITRVARVFIRGIAADRSCSNVLLNVDAYMRRSMGCLEEYEFRTEDVCIY